MVQGGDEGVAARAVTGGGWCARLHVDKRGGLCRGQRGLNVSDVVPRSFDDRMPAGRLTTDPPGVLREPQRATCEQDPGLAYVWGGQTARAT